MWEQIPEPLIGLERSHDKWEGMWEGMREEMRERMLSHVICLSQSEAQKSSPASAP